MRIWNGSVHFRLGLSSQDIEIARQALPSIHINPEMARGNLGSTHTAWKLAERYERALACQMSSFCPQDDLVTLKVRRFLKSGCPRRMPSQRFWITTVLNQNDLSSPHSCRITFPLCEISDVIEFTAKVILPPSTRRFSGLSALQKLSDRGNVKFKSYWWG